MATVFTTTFIQSRITALQAQIVAYETAMTSLSSSAVKSYTLNTGQTTQTVTKRDLSRLQTELDWLIGRLQYWDTLLNNDGVVYARSQS
jgi:CBS domain containing-hemolysin-like protein